MVRKEKGSPMYLRKVAVDEIVTNMVPLILVVLVGEFFTGGGYALLYGVCLSEVILLLFYYSTIVATWVGMLLVLLSMSLIWESIRLLAFALYYITA